MRLDLPKVACRRTADGRNLPIREIVSAVKRSAKLTADRDLRPVVEFPKGTILAGFAAYNKALSGHFKFETTAYNGKDDELSYSGFFLRSLLQETLLTQSEHKVISERISKYISLCEKTNRPPLKFPETHPSCELLIQRVSEGSLTLGAGLRLVQGAPLDQQKSILLKASKSSEFEAACLELLDGDNVDTNPVADEASAQDGQSDDDLVALESKLMAVDESTSSGLYERAKMLSKIHSEKLYVESEIHFFRDYLRQLGISPTHAYRLIRFYRKTPQLLGSFPFRRLRELHDSLTDEALESLERYGRAKLDDGLIDLKVLSSMSFSRMKRTLAPFSRDGVRERISTARANEEVARIRRLMSGLGKCIGNIPEDESGRLLAELRSMIEEVGNANV